MATSGADGNVRVTQRIYFSVKAKKPKWVIIINMMRFIVKDSFLSAVLTVTTPSVRMIAMLERIQSDATLPWSASTGATANRANLVVTPAPTSVELREKAVVPVGQSQRSSREVDVVNASLRALNGVREGFREIRRTEADLQELERLYEKLLPGYKALKDKMDAPLVIRRAAQASREIDAFVMKTSATPPAPMTEAPVEALQMSSDRERTLARIEAALFKVSMLRNKLSDARATSHEAILNINSSVSGLNMARKQVSADKLMASLASAACEALMTKVRSVVVAHGDVSPDLVRLIPN